MNNGFSTGEEDSRGPTDQICCLIDDGDRCRNPAGNASYSKRIQKTVAQRRLKLSIDPNVSRDFRYVASEMCKLLPLFDCRRNTFTFATSTRCESSAQGRNGEERTRRRTAMRPTQIFPKLTSTSSK